MSSPDSLDSLLARYGRFGISLGLETSQALLEQLGNPQAKIPIIHVAGTNGKGSVCAYLSAILTAAGYRVGCYTSPHLVHWSERITINQAPIPGPELLNCLEAVIAATTALPHPPTQFELITAAAWLYFAQEHVDLAVVEVGLGGRLDATNVCEKPLVSVITSIGRDHWQRLGNTLGEIAFEKAGILKPHCPAVIGPVPQEADRVIRQQAELRNTPLMFPEPARYLRQSEPTSTWGTWRNYEFPLLLAGDVQLVNVSLALETIECLKSLGWVIEAKAITTGLQNTRWPGRLQRVAWQGLTLLIDGAHNEPAAQLLRQYLDQQGSNSLTWIIGILASKDPEAILRILLRPQDQLHVVPIPGHEAMTPTALSEIARKVCPGLVEIKSHPDIAAALNDLKNTPTLNQQIVLTGSLYLIGEFFRFTQEAQ